MGHRVTIRHAQLLIFLLLALLQPMVAWAVTGERRPCAVSAHAVPLWCHDAHPAPSSSTTLLAALQEEEDRVIYRAGSGTRHADPLLPGSSAELQQQNSWDTLRESVIRHRYQKEPSLSFPEDGFSQPK